MKQIINRIENTLTVDEFSPTEQICIAKIKGSFYKLQMIGLYWAFCDIDNSHTVYLHTTFNGAIEAIKYLLDNKKDVYQFDDFNEFITWYQEQTK